MSLELEFNLNGIDDFETRCYDSRDRLQPATQALIFATLAVGLADLEAANLGEWHVRIGILKRLNVPLSRDHSGVGWWPTSADLHTHRGLHTNARHQCREAWLTGLVEMVAHEVEYTLAAAA